MIRPRQFEDQTIFEVARRIDSPAVRQAYIHQVCGDNSALGQHVQMLLDALEESESFLESPATQIEQVATRLDASVVRLGGQIGPFKLLQQIGEGGMGVVYMAVQTEPVERHVALKIIKPGMDTRRVIARFEAERQVLAMMDHPNIARVLNAGTTKSGHPYFVMELVKGAPITKYCDDHQLTPRQRLQLFIPVCQAVQHAHQKGIIHRDLKPSNVLVTEYDDRPVPKVIDFGVAKATEKRLSEKTMFTELGQMIGTVDYMSPEQTKLNQLDIDTRSDIYSLGVLLYELLTGNTPFDRGRLRGSASDEAMRIIREEEPPRPSARLSTLKTLQKVAANRLIDPRELKRQLRGELDWIVMKALEKDRTRRYPTANGFANDLQRYLDDKPVLACPPSKPYQLRKFATRNKTPIALLTAAAISLLLLTIGSTIAAKRFRLLAGRNAELASAATESEATANRRLYESYLAHARASRWSRRPGQRLDSLQAVANAAALMRGLGATPSETLALRNEAIAAMGLIDLKHQSEISLQVRDWWTTFDNELHACACVDGASRVCLHAFDGGSFDQHLPFSIPNLGETPVRYASDSKCLVGTDGSNSGRVWDRESGSTAIKFESGVNSSGAFSCRGGRLAYLDHDRNVRVVKIPSGANVLSLPAPSRAVALSPDASKVAIGRADERTIEIWDCATETLTQTFVTGKNQLIRWSPDGNLLAVCQEADYWIEVWNLQTGKRCSYLRGHRNGGNHFEFSGDGTVIASAGWDGTARIWDPYSGHELLRSEAVRCEFRAGNTLLLIHPKRAAAWKYLRSRECRTLRAADNLLLRFTDVTYWWGGPLIACGRRDGIRIWNSENGDELAFAPLQEVGALAFDRDSHSLVTHGGIGVYQWPITISPTGTQWKIGPPRQLIGRTSGRDAADSLSVSRDGKRIAAVLDDDTAAVIVVATKDAGVRLRRRNVSSLSISPDSQYVAASSSFGEGADVWSAVSGEIVAQFWPDSYGARLSHSPDGRFLAACERDEVRLYSTSNWELLQRRKANVNAVQIAWSSDSQRFACAINNQACLYDAETMAVLANFASPNDAGNVQSMRFSPHDDQLCVVYREAVECWDLRRVRRRLCELGLDWKAPPLNDPVVSKLPTHVVFDLGELGPATPTH
jgi:serine/threonine protein kinase/WD40 repeat protein